MKACLLPWVIVNVLGSEFLQILPIIGEFFYVVDGTEALALCPLQYSSLLFGHSVLVLIFKLPTMHPVLHEQPIWSGVEDIDMMAKLNRGEEQTTTEEWGGCYLQALGVKT